MVSVTHTRNERWFQSWSWSKPVSSQVTVINPVVGCL